LSDQLLADCIKTLTVPLFYSDPTQKVFDLTDGSEVGSFQAASDMVSGCSFHPVMGLPLLATASGHRRYPLAPDDSDDDKSSGDDEGDGADEQGGLQGLSRKQQDGFGLDANSNALRLWRMAVEWTAVEDGGGGDEEMQEGAAEADGTAAAGGGGGGGLEGAGMAQGLPLVRV